MTTPLVIILMGSKSDLEHCQKIADGCEQFGIETVMRIGSAHKTAARLLEILAAYEADLAAQGLYHCGRAQQCPQRHG